MTEFNGQEWLRGGASLGAATDWKEEEIRLVAELAFSLAEQGRNADAIVVFEGLAALAPGVPYFKSALGALWLRLGQQRRAISYLSQVLLANPQDLISLVNRGEAALQLGERASARRDLQEAVRLSAEIRQPGSALCVKRARALLRRLNDEEEGGANI